MIEKFIDMENQLYLSSQLITYIGNKRKLLSFIEQPLNEVKLQLNKNKLSIFDGFAGSGVVSRFFKQHSSQLYTNDLEDYVETINKCYLSNISELNQSEINQGIDYLNSVRNNNIKNGIIREYYSPKDDSNIQKNDRCFYTNQNANIIDSIRHSIDNMDNKHFYLAPLLYKASVNNNTSGVFKGFYKDKTTQIGKFGGTNSDAMNRITDEIVLPYPIFSNYECDYTICKGDTAEIVKNIPQLDLAYFDPPYNQHPYSSNYFMLNSILNNNVNPEILSKVSGIPNDWNKSDWNKKSTIKNTFSKLIENTNAKFILVSYNNEGFLTEDDFYEIMNKHGNVKMFEKDYVVFRGGNIKSNKRNNRVKELLFLLKKI
jgi:adenine-specific DNA-methyltransferase